MLKPTKLSRKEKDSAINAAPKTNESYQRGYSDSYMKRVEGRMKNKPVGKLPTKKAAMLKTSADQPRELMKRKEEPAKKKAGLKGLISNAMNKAKSSTYTAGSVKKPLTVTKTKGTGTREVDGKNEMVREKSKTVKRADGTVKKTVTKGKGIGGSVIGRYKDVKR